MKANMNHIYKRLWTGGDVSVVPSEAVEQLEEMVRKGITDVIDCRVEVDSDEEREMYSSWGIDYHYLGVDDQGGDQPDDFWTGIHYKAYSVLASPERKLLVHCHMGVNRGPSGAFSVLVGHYSMNPITAFNLIRSRRPEAFVIYAVSYLEMRARKSTDLNERADWSKKADQLKLHIVNTVDWEEQRKTIGRLRKEDSRQYRVLKGLTA